MSITGYGYRTPWGIGYEIKRRALFTFSEGINLIILINLPWFLWQHVYFSSPISEHLIHWVVVFQKNVFLKPFKEIIEKYYR